MKQILQTHLGKALLCLLMVVLGGSNAWGETVTYTKVTATPSDWSGTYVIVADLTETNGQIFTGQNSSNNYGGNNGVTITNSSVTGDYSAYEVEVEASGDYYSIKHINSSKYLGWTSGNYLYFSTTTPTTDSYRWKLSTSSILNANDNTRKLQYNSGSPRFACYTSSQKVAYLYKKAETTTSVATPTFSPAGGTYTSAQNVTLSTTTDEATIYYTTDGTEPTTSSSVYSSAIPVSATTTIKAIAVKDGLDDSSIASATYTILEHAGTSEDPYSVADARAAIDANIGMQNVYVTGIVCEGGSSLSNGAMNYWISDDGTETNKFEIYKGKGISGADFETTSDIQVGDIVVVTGNLTKYSSTYEFSASSQLVSLDRPIIPSITANNVEIEYNATSGSIDFTVNNETQDGVLTAAITAGNEGSWLSLGAVTTSVALTCSANEGNADRAATVTLTYTYNTSETVTKTVTVTQKHYVVDYAELPFEWLGGAKNDLTDLTGVTASGLGSDYADSNAPYRVKMDGVGDYILIKTDGQPGVVSVGVKMIGGGTTSKIKVQQSADGTNFTDVEELTISGNSNAEVALETTNAFSSASRYVKIIKSVHGSNIGVGPISIAKASTEPAIVAESSVDLADTDTSGEIAYSINNPNGNTLTATTTTDWISNVTVDSENSKVTFTTTANTGAERVGTITLSYTGADNKVITVTQAEYVVELTYNLATSITSGKHYIISALADKAMGGQNTNNRAAVDVTNSYGSVTFLSNAGVTEFIIYGPDADGLYTIYDASENGYLYAASSGANHLKTQTGIDDNARWKITFDDEDDFASIIAEKSSNRNVMQFNSTLFSCYATASQTAVYLYEKDGEATPTESVTVTDAGYATFCSENALDFTGSSIKAYVGTRVGNALTFSEVTKVPANEGMLLVCDGGTTTNIPTLTGAANVVTNNCLKGVTKETTLKADDYILNVVNGGAGFYKAGDDYKVLSAHKAYIPALEGSNIKSFGINLTTGIDLPATEKAEKVIFDLSGRRVEKPAKGLYIVNGKKVLF